MIAISLAQIAQATQGQLIGEPGCENLRIDQITTDTRAVSKGSLFVALIGEKFDAHDFIDQAIESGAGALLVSKKLQVSKKQPSTASENSRLPQILVADTTKALGAIGALVHQQSQVTTLALTGSCGKTTVKEMLNAILKQKGKVLFTAGNFNNEIGVPLTLFRRQADDDYAVIELGANHLGEIAYTTQLVKPDVALVNNVAAAHLEGFGSIDGVKKAKGEIFDGLSENGVAVVNLDSNGLEFWGLEYWQKAFDAKNINLHQASTAQRITDQRTTDKPRDKQVITFSESDINADFYAQDIQVDDKGHASFMLCTPQGKQSVNLPLIGQHNVPNALAASAMAMQVGANLQEVVTGLQVSTNVKGRVEVIDLTNNIRLIDDSYNASVPAMKAAVDLLTHYSGKRWLILGFMAELGAESADLHKEVGVHVAKQAFDYVLTYGDDTEVISRLCDTQSDSLASEIHTAEFRTSECQSESKQTKNKTCGQHFTSHDMMIDFICQQLAKDSTQHHTLLIKGANSARMSLIVAALKEKFS